MSYTQPHNGPTFTQKLKMGAMMGSGVGLGLGFILGNIQYLVYGARGKGYLGTLANSMMTSGATFGFFMAVGSVIRTEEGHSSRLNSLSPYRPRQIFWAASFNSIPSVSNDAGGQF